jgi:hypothetical protein
MNQLIRNLSILFFFSICACASQPKGSINAIPSNLPEPKELSDRIIQLYDAEMNQDWLTWYNLTTLKKEIGYDDFLKSMRAQKIDYKIVSYRTKRFVNKPLPKDNGAIKAAVAVEMDVRISRAFLSSEKVKDQTDYWVYTGESWLLQWRGFPAD